MSKMKHKIYIDKDAVLHKLWIAATVAGCFFLPLGLIMVLSLFIYEYRNYEKLEPYVLFCGIANIVFAFGISAGFTFFTMSMEDFKVTSLMIVFYLPGALCGVVTVFLYLLTKRKRFLCDSCLMFVTKEHIVSVQKMADILGIKYQAVRNVLAELIKSGRLKNAEIDDNKKELVLSESIWFKQLVVCENCGAELVVDLGQTLTCEYCGSALRVKRVEETEK